MSVCEGMGVEKVNTSTYHPQSDGLVDRFNCTLTDMLVKSVFQGISEWDLFSYGVSLQLSTGESPFFFLYGRDP